MELMTKFRVGVFLVLVALMAALFALRAYNVQVVNATVSDNQLFYQLEVKDGHFAYKPKGFFVNVLPSINYYIKWK